MTLADIRTRILERIEVDPLDPAWQFAANAAINEGQRLFVFLTLCLEVTRILVLTPGNSAYSMLAIWPDWLIALRVRISNDLTGGAVAEFDSLTGDGGMFNEQAYSGLTLTAAPKLRAETLTEMAAADPAFLNSAGQPTRYGIIGWDLLFLNQNPNLIGQKLLITYARCCQPLVLDADVPEIPVTDHDSLIGYGIARLRANEGGAELENAAPLLADFLATAKVRAQQVRVRSIAARYDRQPFELVMGKGK